MTATPCMFFQFLFDSFSVQDRIGCKWTFSHFGRCQVSKIRRNRPIETVRWVVPCWSGVGSQRIEGCRSGVWGHVGHWREEHTMRVHGGYSEDARVGGYVGACFQRLGKAHWQGWVSYIITSKHHTQSLDLQLQINHLKITKQLLTTIISQHKL